MTFSTPIVDDQGMLKYITTTLLILFYCLNTEAFADVKTEVEFKINLTQTGFNKLKTTFIQKYKGEESSRSDFYFDIFKNDAYQLKTAQPPFKIRFQWNGSDLTWQTQKVLSSSVLSIFSVKKTESISMDIPSDQLMDSIKNYHSKLNALDPYALTLASQIQTTLNDSGILSFTQTLCPQCTKEERYFSTHMNTKSRVKVKLKTNDDQFNIQVGETNNNGILSYELEAEVKKSSDLVKSAETLHKWLTANGLEATHIDSSIAVDPTKDSEEKLKQLF